MPSTDSLILLALLWLGYFLSHSWFASLGVKRWVVTHLPSLMPWYRLSFNGLAVLLLIPPLALMWHLRTDPLWEWQGIGAWFVHGLSLLALIGFLGTLRIYDAKEFLGLRQLRMGSQDVRDQERLRISPLHRYIRHPWYGLGLVLVWTQEMDPARLLSAVLISLYLIIGSRIEERKLLVYHGDVYREYRRLVPGLIPIPWRRLSRKQADDLLHRAHRHPGAVP
jgi:protein-S-isoprenylcysteine O-methyltransferase Ste14